MNEGELVKMESKLLPAFNPVSSRTVLRLFEKLTGAACEGYGLTRTEIDVLAFLKNNPGMDTASDVVEYRHLSKAGVSQAVELLTQKGLLTRAQDPKDRRQIHLTLTEAAQEPARALAEAREQLEQILFEGFTEQEIRLYLELTQRTQQNAKNALERI